MRGVPSRGAALVFVVALALTLGVCTGATAQQDKREGNLYTTQNLWYEDPLSLWCINYQTGTIIPAGTEVTGVGLAPAQTGRTKGGERIAISFVRVADNQKFFVNITAKYHPGKTIRDYMQDLFSEKNFGQLTKGLSDKEIKAIKEGVVVEGMSKRAVLISVGIPPQHKTPTLDGKRWMYWVNRFRDKTICFGDNDRAVDCSAVAVKGQL